MLENVYLVYEMVEHYEFEVEGVYANREDAEKAVERINAEISDPEWYAFITERIVRYTSE